MSSSVGMMTFPIYGKNKNDANHQPEIVDLPMILLLLTMVIFHSYGML